MHAEHGEVQVVVDGQAAEQARRLERAREPQAGALARGQRGHVAAEQLDRAGRRRELARDQVEQRGLPGPVRPEDRAPLAGPDVEVDARRRRRRRRSAGRPPASGGSARRLQRMSRELPSTPSRRSSTSSALPTHGGRRALLALRVLAVRRRACPRGTRRRTSGRRRGCGASVWTSGTPSPVLSATIFFTNTFEIAWRLSSSLTSPHGASSPDSVVARRAPPAAPSGRRCRR